MPKLCTECDYLISDETKVYQENDKPTLTVIEILHCPECGTELENA